MPMVSCSGRLHRVSTAVRKFTRDNSDIFNAAAVVFTAFLALATFCVSVQANSIAEKYGRLEAYSKPLSYAIEVENGSAEQIISADNVLCLSDTPIDVVPSHGGISDIYAVAYSGGIVSSVLPLSFSGQGLDSNDPDETYWRLDKYSIPLYGYDLQGSRYGSLYLVIRDYQNGVHLNMITYTFDERDGFLVLREARVFNEFDLLLRENEDSFNNVNIGSFNTRQLKEFSEFKRLVEETI